MCISLRFYLKYSIIDKQRLITQISKHILLELEKVPNYYLSVSI